MDDLEIDVVKNDLHKNEKSKEIWEKPIVHSLLNAVSMIPFAAPIVSGLAKTVDNELAKQIKKRCEVVILLLMESDSVSFEDVQDIEFIMEFAHLLDAVTRTRSISKIKYMSQLFHTTMCNGIRKYDVYEECLLELSTMSEREIQVLVELYIVQHCRPDVPFKNRGKVFYTKMQDVYDEDEKMVDTLLSKLRRTGFCMETLGPYASDSGIQYDITSYGVQFMEYILEV